MPSWFNEGLGLMLNPTNIATYASEAAPRTGQASVEARNHFIGELCQQLLQNTHKITKQNEMDLKHAQLSGLPEAMIQRLKFDEAKLAGRLHSLEIIERLSDPLGRIADLRTRPNGLQVGKMRVPLGVLAMIYEARPHVTVNAAAFAVKSGNACILKGGRETVHTNRALAECIGAALEIAGLPQEAVQVITDVDHDWVVDLVKQDGLIDLVIPRGGTKLIDAVSAAATVPVLKHYRGVCQAYLHSAADLEKAVPAIVNSKCFMPEVCNALENLYVDHAIAERALPRLVTALTERGVTLQGCDRTARIVPGVQPATDKDFDREALDLELTVGVVDDYDSALTRMRRHGSGHTEVIMTEDHDTAMRFLREMDAGVVGVNVSTMFNDGEELGLGAEVGISTDKLHARGPMGLADLTCEKWILLGSGQIKTG